MTSDAELVAAIANGDETAFATLFDRHGGLVLGVLIRFVGERSEAEDLVQEVFLAAWDNAARYSPSRGGVKTWLVMMARSRALDLLRSRSARSERANRWVEEVVPTLEEPTGTKNLEREEGAKSVRTALASLPEEQQTCVALSFFEGLSQTQIASRLELPLGTVKYRFLSGMKKLRETLVGPGEN